MYIRQTALAEAMIKAAIKSGDLDSKVDHQHWVARRVAHNAIERPKMSQVKEYDRVPKKTASLHAGEESYTD